MITTIAALWAILALTSLAFTLAYDDGPLTPKKTIVALTLGPIAVVIGAIVLSIAGVRQWQ